MGNTVQIAIEVDPKSEKKARQLAKGEGLSLNRYFEKMIRKNVGRAKTETTHFDCRLQHS